MGVVKLCRKKIHEDILRESRILRIHAGTAEIIADEVTEKIMKWGAKRKTMTSEDLNQRIANEVRKFNKDLAYLFESREKLI